MAVSALKVANEFLRLAREARPQRFLTPMQLMKLVYIAHGWSLALQDRALVSDEIQAWQYGPVIPDLYAQVKRFGRTPVTGDLQEGIWSFGRNLDNGAKELIAEVFEKYGHLNGVQLSNLTHMPGTPWATVYEPKTFSIGISDDLISDHYKQLARQRAG